MRYRFKHTHLSTRYDKSVDSLRRVVKGYTDTADVITLTEVDSERREKVLRDLPNWGFAAGDKTGRDDCAILWDQKVWRLIDKDTYNVSPYMAGNIGAVVVILEFKETGKHVLFSVVHTPSSVEGNGRVSGGRRDEWFEAVKRWRNRCEMIAKSRNIKHIVLVADWNINLKAKWVQSLIRTLFPKYQFVWNLRDLPVGGTHGPRLIDWTMTKGLVVERRPQIHRSTAASDHKGYDELLGF